MFEEFRLKIKCFIQLLPSISTDIEFYSPVVPVTATDSTNVNTAQCIMNEIKAILTYEYQKTLLTTT